MKILIVDDHVLVRKGLKSLLISYNPLWEVHEAINGIQAIIKAPDIHPDIVLMDYSMPKLNGMRASAQLLKDLPGINIIMISGFISRENIRELLGTGIKGIVSKTAGTEDIVAAIYNVMNGEQHLIVESDIGIQEEKQPKTRQGAKQGKPVKVLFTRREIEVLRLIIKGHTPEMIIEQLGVSRRTLETHRSNIYKKCGLHSTAELVQFAFMNNLILPGPSKAT